MTETIKTWRAEPLTWGRGPRQFEMFLEPTCPYSPVLGKGVCQTR